MSCKNMPIERRWSVFAARCACIGAACRHTRGDTLSMELWESRAAIVDEPPSWTIGATPGMA